MKHLMNTSIALILIAGMAAASSHGQPLKGQGMGQGFGQGQGMGQGKGMGQGQGFGRQGAGQGNLGAHFMENWDLDEDGKVTREEAAEKRGELFVMFDQDENGVLDKAEYDLFDETREGQREANQPDNARGPRNAIEGMDRSFTDGNGDGEVTRDEFMAVGDDWFARRDHNGDGVLTEEDFGPRRQSN